MTTARSRAAPDRCSNRGMPPSSAGSSCATPTIVSTPLVSVVSERLRGRAQLLDSPARACPAPPPARPGRPRGLETDASAHSETSSAACSPSGASGVPALSIPITIVSVAKTALSRPWRTRLLPALLRLRLRLLGRAADRARQANIRDDRLDLAAPHAHRSADTLRPLARRNGLAAPVAVADQRRDHEHDHDPGDDRDLPSGARASPMRVTLEWTRRRCRQAAVQNRCDGRDADPLVGGMRAFDLRSESPACPGAR